MMPPFEKIFSLLRGCAALLAVAGSMGNLTAGPAKPPVRCEEFAAGVKAVCPEFARFGTRSGQKVPLLDAGGAEAGRLLLAPEKYTRKEGYNGYVSTAVVLGKDGKITGVVLGKNRESPGWIRRLRKGGLLTRWNGMTVKQGAAAEVDGVASATYSSNAVRAEVKAILENAE